MNKDYKEIKTQKMDEAKKIMSNEEFEQCKNIICSTNMAYIPILLPSPRFVKLIDMIKSIGKVFNKKISELEAKESIQLVTCLSVEAQQAYFIPAIGNPIFVVIKEIKENEAIGWTVAVDIAKSKK